MGSDGLHLHARERAAGAGKRPLFGVGFQMMGELRHGHGGVRAVGTVMQFRRDEVLHDQFAQVRFHAGRLFGD